VFIEKLLRKFKFHQNLTKVAGTVHEDQCTFFITSGSFLLGMRNDPETNCRENFQKLIFENLEMLWKNIVEPERSQMIT